MGEIFENLEQPSEENLEQGWFLELLWIVYLDVEIFFVKLRIWGKLRIMKWN